MLGACGSILLYNTMRDAAILYYFKYFIGDRSVWFFGELSVNALSSVFMSTLLCANMVGVVLATPVAGMIGKKQTLILSGVVTAVLSIGFFFVHPSPGYPDLRSEYYDRRLGRYRVSTSLGDVCRRRRLL